MAQIRPALDGKAKRMLIGKSLDLGSLPSVMNAVVDALSEFGITHIDMPATPYRIWQAIQDARS